MPACSSVDSSTTIRPSVMWRTPSRRSRSGSGTVDLRSPSTATKLRISSRVTPRVNVIFSISRSRRSRAKPTSAAVPRGSRIASTTTSSPMKPTTMLAGVCSASLRRGDERVDAALHQRMVGE